MTPANAILAELRARGVRIELRPHGGIRLVPARLIDSHLLDRIREHKAALLAWFHVERQCAPAGRALALLNRLRSYTLPVGRMPAACGLALRLEPLKDADSGTILAALQDFERELIALGGAPDPELVETVAAVESAFPGSRLVEVGKLQ